MHEVNFFEQERNHQSSAIIEEIRRTERGYLIIYSQIIVLFMKSAALVIYTEYAAFIRNTVIIFEKVI